MVQELNSRPMTRAGLQRQQQGVTLIELMIAVVIISILASVALPSYDQYVKKSRRSDGAAQLSRIMQQQERFFLNNMTYTEDLSDLGYDTSGGAVESQEGYYNISADTCDGVPITRCVLLTADPLAGQEEDGALTLSSRGEKTHDGNPGWDH